MDVYFINKCSLADTLKCSISLFKALTLNSWPYTVSLQIRCKESHVCVLLKICFLCNVLIVCVVWEIEQVIFDSHE